MLWRNLISAAVAAAVEAPDYILSLLQPQHCLDGAVCSPPPSTAAASSFRQRPKSHHQPFVNEFLFQSHQKNGPRSADACDHRRTRRIRHTRDGAFADGREVCSSGAREKEFTTSTSSEYQAKVLMRLEWRRGSSRALLSQTMVLNKLRR
jgi:hypothetical protein